MHPDIKPLILLVDDRPENLVALEALDPGSDCDLVVGFVGADAYSTQYHAVGEARAAAIRSAIDAQLAERLELVGGVRDGLHPDALGIEPDVLRPGQRVALRASAIETRALAGKRPAGFQDRRPSGIQAQFR